MFKLSEKAASRSKLIKDMINDYEDEVDFPLPEVRTEALEKIVEYLKHYENSEPKEIPRPLQDSQINKILDEWDFNFINSISKEEARDCHDRQTEKDAVPDRSKLLSAHCRRLSPSERLAGADCIPHSVCRDRLGYPVEGCPQYTERSGV